MKKGSTHKESSKIKIAKGMKGNTNTPIGNKHAFTGGNTLYGFRLDPALMRRLDNVILAVRKDDDWLAVVDGRERTGKSVFAMQLGQYVSEGRLKLKNIVFDAEDFIRAVKNAEKYDVIIFDEAFRGGSWRQNMTKLSNSLHQVMMEMGQKNLFVIIVIPDALELSSYIKYHRSKVLFHVYKYKGMRGFWKAWTGNRKKELLYKAVKKRTYMVGVKGSCGGRFPNHYCVDEEAYRAKKGRAFDKSITKKIKVKEEKK